MQQQAQTNADPSDMTDSSSQSDDYGNCRPRRKATYLTSSSISRRKKGSLNAKERNLRRLESNERERMRMHSLNDAFQVGSVVARFLNSGRTARSFYAFAPTKNICSLAFFIKILITSTIYVQTEHPHHSKSD